MTFSELKRLCRETQGNTVYITSAQHMALIDGLPRTEIKCAADFEEGQVGFFFGKKIFVR